MRAGLVEGVTRAQVPWIRNRTCDRGDSRRRVVHRQAPGRADEGGAVDARDIASRRVAGADVAGLRATLYLGAEVRQRTMATPAIGYPAHLLSDLALKVPGPPDPAEAGTGRVRVAAVILRRDQPLDAFK